MQRPTSLLCIVLFAAGAVTCAQAAGPSAAAAAHARQGERFWPLIEQYCNDCHNAIDWAGGIAFDTLSPETIPHEPEIWESTVRRMRGRLMPPPGDPQPDQEDIDGLVSWLEGYLDSSGQAPPAGHVPIQRLNRTEYANAVRSLLGVSIDVAQLLPPEIEVEGFDNIAAALSVSPAFLDQYIAAARTVARLAVGDPSPRPASAFYPAPGGSQDAFVPGLPLGTRGGMSFKHHFPADGEYRLSILDLDIGLYPAAAESRHTLVVLVAGREVFRQDVGGPEDLALVDRQGADGRAAIMERFADIPIEAQAGTHEVVVTFVERARALTDEYIGAGLFNRLRVPRLLDGIEVTGPYAVKGISSTPSREKIFVCQPPPEASTAEERACAERIARHLARGAFRRPVEPRDIERLMPFYEVGRTEGGSFDHGITQLVAAILSSPDFLFRAIRPRDDADAALAEAYPLDDLALASRLAFFLWSQGPDAELLRLAEAGKLGRPKVLQTQVRRMLADARARMLVTGFALKWLNLDDLDAVEPDPRLFPTFTPQLRADLAREIELFVASILLEDRSVLDLLTADHTFLNERLARHYGVQGVHGPQFRRVQLADETRWGVLGKGATHLRTSYGDRTSPVLRGAWVLEKLMGTPPTPPPPGVETDLSPESGSTPKTLRARLEFHRTEKSCNQCHGVIDPIGFALENFDVTGRWRDWDPDAGEPIDASTVLPNGAHIDGPVELRRELMRRPEQFVQALTEKLLMYALNRELEWHDMPQVRAIVRAAARDDYRFSAIIRGIVASDAFRMQGRPHLPGEPTPQVALHRPVHGSGD